MKITRYISLLATILLIVSNTGCAMEKLSKQETKGSIEQKNSTELRNEMKNITLELANLSSNLHCDNSAECQSVPVGHKACGGPSKHQPYSTLIGKEKVSRLKQLSKRSSKIDRELNRLLSRVSTCSYIGAPKMMCSSNQCIKVKVMRAPPPSCKSQAPLTGLAVVKVLTELRTNPDVFSDTVMEVQAGTEVNVNAIDAGWACVTVGDQQGFIYMDYLDKK